MSDHHSRSKIKYITRVSFKLFPRKNEIVEVFCEKIRTKHSNVSFKLFRLKFWRVRKFLFFENKISVFLEENFETYHSIVSRRGPVNFDIILFSHMRHHFHMKMVIYGQKLDKNWIL